MHTRYVAIRSRGRREVITNFKKRSGKNIFSSKNYETKKADNPIPPCGSPIQFSTHRFPYSV